MKPLDQWRVLIVGLGQIGGSLGLDLIKRRLVARVVGFDINEDTMARALERGAVEETARSLEEGVPDADLVILAVPIRQVIPAVTSIAPNLSEECVVLDVAGTKSEILAAVAALDPPVNYIGGHPIAGTEGAGIDAAQHDLFEGAAFVLTRRCSETRTKVRATRKLAGKGGRSHQSAGANSQDLPQHSKVGATQNAGTPAERWLQPNRELVIGLGARPIEMAAEDHDRIIALTSHLPHVLALALSNLARKSTERDAHTRDMIGGSFRSATRVAASSPELIVDMLLTNRERVGAAIDEVVAELTSLKSTLSSSDESSLSELIERVQRSL